MIPVEQGSSITLASNENAELLLVVYDAEGAAFKVQDPTTKADDVALTSSSTDKGVSISIPAGALDLGLHIVTVFSGAVEWSFAVDTVSAHVISIPSLREYKDADGDLFSDADKYPSSQVFFARAAATEKIEHALGYELSTHLHVSHVRADGTAVLPFGAVQKIVSCAAPDGTSVPSMLISDRRIEVGHTGDLTVTYLSGKYPDETDRRCVMKLAASYLRPSSRPENATGESGEFGNIYFSIAGRDGSTGIPDVDAYIQERASQGVLMI